MGRFHADSPITVSAVFDLGAERNAFHVLVGKVVLYLNPFQCGRGIVILQPTVWIRNLGSKIHINRIYLWVTG